LRCGRLSAVLKWFIYWLWLHPIIIADYRKRLAGAGVDQWHWADLLAVRWGYWTDFDGVIVVRGK